MSTARRFTLAASLAAAALSLAACTSTATTTVRTPSSPASAAAAPSTPALAAAPSATPSPPPCTTHACIASGVEQSLAGLVAQDESVITKATCQQSTVRHAAPGVWTVHCTATYTDGAVWAGIATVLLSKGQVTWEPTEQLQ